MELTANSALDTFILRGGRDFGLPASRGQIEEKANIQPGRLDLPGPDAPLCTPPVAADCVGAQANSFFDVMFEIEVPGVGKLRNKDSLRIEVMISEKPPRTRYRHVITDPIELFDENGNAMGVFLVTAAHDTRPELDHFKCYDVIQGHPVNVGVELTDQFLTEKARVTDPFIFCDLAAKRHNNQVAPIKDPDAHLKFYDIVTEGPTEQRAVEVTNQFGRNQKLDVFRPLFLAVPSQKRVLGSHAPPKNLDYFKCYGVNVQPVNAGVGLRDQFIEETDAKILDPFIIM